MADFDFIQLSVNAEDIERIAKMEINDTSIDENSENNSLPTSAVVFNAIFGKRYFYKNLETAFSDVNNGQIGANSLVTSDGATVSVHIDNGEKVITLLEDTNVSALEYIVKTMTIDLNGKTLSLGTGVALRTNTANIVLTIIGNNGKIVKNLASTTANERIFFAYAGSIKVLGGEYIIDIKDATVTSTVVCQCRGGATLDLNGCSFSQLIHGSTSSSTKSSIVIYGIANSKLNIENCTIFSDVKAYQGNGIYCFGELSLIESRIDISAEQECNGILIESGANTHIVSCSINSNSIGGVSTALKNLGVAKVEKTKLFGDGLAGSIDYDAYSRGVYNSDTIELIDCQAYGIHSGLSSTGECYINGGLYEGINHGGLYLANTSNSTTEAPKEMFVENATIAGAHYRGKNKAKREGIFNPLTSLYVSSGCNLSLYLDNCILKGGYQWVMAVSYQNNKVYMSNCSIDLSFKGFATTSEVETIRGLSTEELASINAETGVLKTMPKNVIRVDSALSKIYFGLGNNFKINHLLAYHSANAAGYDEITDVFEETNQRYYVRDIVKAAT